MKLLCLISALTAISCTMAAQNIVNYQFAASPGSFTPLTGATTIPLSGGNTDDGWFNGIPVAFTFYYMGVPYTTVSASTKGWLTFGQNISNAGYNNLLASGGTRPLIAPLWDDHDIQAATNFSFQTTGTAPDRIFTAQWLNVKWKYSATAGGISFQVKLYEAGGKIEFIYHPEAGALASPTGSIGITASGTGPGNFLSLSDASASPTVNSNTETTSIATKPADGQVYAFVPPASSPAPPVSMNYTDITRTSMTINWTDNSTTETWFVAWFSQDGVNFSQVGTVVSTTTSGTGASYSINKTGLLPGVTYYFRVAACTEGNPPSGFLTGSLAAAAPAEITSIASGNWSATSTWSTGAVPTSLDNVTIANTHTVTIDALAECTCNALTVGQGSSGILRYGATGATLSTIQGIVVAAGGIFDAGTTNLSTHILKIGGVTATAMGTGSLTVAGTFDMYVGPSNGRCTVTFFGIPDASVSGSGTIDFYRVVMNKGAVTATATTIPPILEIDAPCYGSGVATTGYIYTHTAGTVKIGGTFPQSNSIYFSAGYDIPITGGLWLNNGNFIMNGLNGSPNNNGLLKISAGTCNIGTSSNNAMAANAGAVFMIENGTVNIAGRLNTANQVTYIQGGGTVNVTTAGNTSSGNPGFGITNAASVFTMSGGTIALSAANTGTTKVDFYNNAGTTNITGGLLTGSSGTIKTYYIRGTAPNVTLTNSGINHSFSLAGNLVVKGDLTLNGTGTFSVLGYSLTMAGMDATNPGNIVIGTGATITLNTAAAATLSFTGSYGNQSLTNSGTITGNQFPGLTINNTFGGSGTVTIPTGLTMIGDATLNLASGTLSCGSGITAGTGGTTGFTYMRGNGSISGTLTRNYGSGTVNYTYNGTTAQATGIELPSSITGTFTINNPAGVTLTSALQAGKFTLTSGTLTTTTTNLLTITGTAAGDLTYTAGQVSGPLERTLPASLATGTVYLFPLGKGAYRPLELVDPVTAGGTMVIRTEVFDAATGGTPGSTMMSLNGNRYWQATATAGGANLTSTRLRITEEGLTSNSGLAKSATLAGTYELVSVNPPSGNTLISGTMNTLSYYVMGEKRMNYVSSTVTQAITTYVREGSQNQEIIGLQIVTSGALDPALATSFTFNTNGTTRVADIAGAKVFYTGTSSTFAATNQFGSTYANPSGSFIIAGSQALAEGTNYFWLVYDIAMGVVDNDVVDAEFNSVTVRGVGYTPSTQAPAGTRTVRAALTGNITVGAAGDYPTLTGSGGLFEKIALVGLKGNVTALIVSNITEPATNAITQWYEAGGSGYLLTISPDAAIARTLSGSYTGGLIRLSNVSRVTFDGRYAGSGKYLSIINSAASGAIAALQFIGTAPGQGCTNITIRNCNLSTGHNGSTSYGIVMSASSLSSAGYDHDQVTIRECKIFKATYGIYADASTSGLYDNMVIDSDSVGSTIAGSEISRTGLYLFRCPGVQVTGNRIFNIISTSSETRGLYLGPGSINATVSGNMVTGIRSTAGTTYGSTGMFISPGSGTANITVANNIVTDITAVGGSNIASAGIAGIKIYSGTNHNIYYNSVNLVGSVSHAVAGDISTAIYFISSSGIVLKDNIFRNSIVNTAASAYAYAIYSDNDKTAFASIDYNDYFPSGSQGTLLGYCYNSGAASTIAAWRTITGKDVHSISADPLFTSEYDLHLDNSSPARFTGTPVAGITTDFENVARPESNPTMGALETTVDALGPFINYTLLKNTASLSARTLVVTLTDSTGVPTSGPGLPVLYWNRNHGSWNAATAVFLGGTQYQFTFGSGVAINDSVFYFIAAQDTQTTPRVSVKPSDGAYGFTYNPPACSTKPINPSTYKVVIGLNGTITIGAGGQYPTITGTGGLFEAVKNNLLNGNVNAAVISDLSEPGTIQLTTWLEEGPGNYTLSVIPDGTTERLISGNVAAGMITLNGAKRFNINGSSGDTTSRYLRLRNTNNTYPVIRFLNGSQYNTIRNCHIESTGSSVHFSTTSVYTGNSFNQILYNAIHDRTDATGIPFNGVYSSGTESFPNKSNTIRGNDIYNFSYTGVNISSTGNGGEWVIEGNSFFNNLATPPSTLQRGIYFAAGGLSFGNHIEGNYIGGQAPRCGGNSWENTGTDYFYGIYLDAGYASNHIRNNTISNIYQSNGNSDGFYGIMIYDGWCGIEGNTIGNSDLSKSIRSGATYPFIYGIRVESGSICSVKENTVANLVLTATSGYAEVYGIYIYAADLEKNKLYGLGHCVNAGLSPRVLGVHNDGLSGGVYTEVSNNSIAIDCGASANPEIIGYYEYSYTENTVDFFYNSISISGPATLSQSTYAFYRYIDASMNMKDNILANFRQTTGGGPAYAIYFEDPGNLVSDYNDLYCAHGNLGYYGAINRPDLTAWRTATSGDQHSISSDPLFLINAGDLNPATGSPVASAGIPLEDVTTDINDNPRDPVSPTIGCYESPMTIDKTWNGTTSVTWNVSSNWTPAGVPLSSENVLIPASTPNPCTVNTAGMVCKSISIAGGATLNLTSNNSLTVYGSLTIQDGGTLNNNGMLILKGNLYNLNAAK